MTGDPARDREATPHHFGGTDEPMEDEYAQHARDRREAEQKARMDAAHEKAKAEREGEHSLLDHLGEAVSKARKERQG